MSKVLVTGANRGIGLELVSQLQQKNFEVIAVVRKSSSQLNDLKPYKIIEEIDLLNEDSFKKLSSQLDGEELDLVIQNAGIAKFMDLNSIDSNGLIEQYKVNAMAPLMLTCELIPFMKKPSKLALITSRMGSMQDNDSGGSYGYRMSKAALNAAGKSLSIDLKDSGVSVAILHPGWVQTDMTKHSGHYKVDQAARQILERIDELNIENTGTFWHSSGEVLPF